MVDFWGWSGSYLNVAKVLPGCTLGSYAGEGYAAWMASSDPRDKLATEIAEKLFYCRRGLIKYGQRIFYYDAYQQGSQFYSDEQLQKMSRSVGRSYVPGQVMLMEFPLNTVQEFLDTDVFFKEIFETLPLNQTKIYRDDEHLLPFNRLKNTFSFVTPLWLDAALKEQITTTDLDRQSYFSIAKTAEQLKARVQRSKLYRAYAQGDFTAAVFPGLYRTFLYSRLTVSPEKLRQGVISFFYEDDAGRPCGIAMEYFRDDSNQALPVEQRNKIYCISIIKDALSESLAHRYVTFITHADDIPGVSLQWYDGAKPLTHQAVLETMQREIGSQSVYQLFSSPVRDHEHFMEYFAALTKRIKAGRNVDDRDVRKAALDRLLVVIKRDMKQSGEDMAALLQCRMTSVDFFEEGHLGRELADMWLRYTAYVSDAGKIADFKSAIARVWLAVKQFSFLETEEEYQRYQRDIDAEDVSRMVWANVQAEWAWLRAMGADKARAYQRWQRLVAERDMPDVTLRVIEKELSMAHEARLRESMEWVRYQLSVFSAKIKQRRQVGDAITSNAWALHKTLELAIQRHAHQWQDSDKKMLLSMIRHCCRGLDTPLDTDNTQQIIALSSLLSKRSYPSLKKTSYASFAFAAALFLAGIATTVTTVLLATPFILPIVLAGSGLLFLVLGGYLREKQKVVLKSASQYALSLGTFAPPQEGAAARGADVSSLRTQ